ncbi:MAG TPA: DUF4145 domain-containing protein [Anaerolineales bacterium]|nr:DUF4145 domain-containing protein [Anaerolineales bacterium]
MTQPSVPTPSISLASFACPHCGAHATQHWHYTKLERCQGTAPLPLLLSEERLKKIEENLKGQEEKDRAVMEKLVHFQRRLLLGEPFVERTRENLYDALTLANIFVSQCYTCKRVALWLHDRLLYPPTMTGPAPNADLSADVMRDYEEARSILDLSPRGAAALLRLAVEKICIELGATGDDINKRIADLVSKGMPAEVQQALDAVRVIGNEAVHPGRLDLRDDRDTALSLFALVNFIAEDRITRPKQRSAIYDMIPPAKREAIDARNAKALDGSK